MEPESGQKIRFKGTIYRESWTPRVIVEDESAEEKQEKTRKIIANLEQDLVHVLEKRSACNRKRYPSKWANIEPQFRLVLPEKQEASHHDRNGKNTQSIFDPLGAEFQRQTDNLRSAAENPGGQPDASPVRIEDIETLIQRCQRSVRELADHLGEIEKRRIEQEAPAPRMRMR
jgi:hypothetical protein